jgi:RNAse (barnase) inhibitor barstar
MTKTLEIVGGNVRDIETFYDEINRVFMATEDWKLGPSLDALDDMLGGEYGAITGRERVRLVWKGMEASRSNLGVEATRAHLLAKLARPDVFNAALIDRQLEELEVEGRTYFDIVVEVVAGHPNIELVPA